MAFALEGVNIPTVCVCSNADPYKIRQVMNVTATKILVGNPVNPPQFVGAPGVERFFTGTSCDGIFRMGPG